MSQRRFQKLWHVIIELDEKNQPPDYSVLSMYCGALGSFIAFLRTYQQTNVLLRLASNRKIVDQVQRANEAIDTLFHLLQLEHMAEMSNWRSETDQCWERQQNEMQELLKNQRVIMRLLSDGGLVEALTLLKYEFQHQREKNKPTQVQMMEHTFFLVVRASKDQVSAIPLWFIPFYEVVFSNEEFEYGEFGRVNRGTLTHTKVVIKTLLTDGDSIRTSFFKEAEIWIKLDHPHVLMLYGACHVRSPPFFVCEDAVNGNFKQYFSQGQNRNVFWQLFREATMGLLYLTNMGIQHGKLGCNNLLVGADGKARISDFGCIQIRHESRAISRRSSLGSSLRWLAPECLYNNVECRTVSSVVYTLGMCIIEAWASDVPWGSDCSDSEVLSLICNSEMPTRPRDMSARAWALVQRMCLHDPTKRIPLDAAANEMTAMAKEESERICPSCSTPVQAGFNFCASCGSMINATGTQHSRKKLEVSLETPDASATEQSKLDTVKSLCDAMNEAQAMCVHIYSRLLSFGEHVANCSSTSQDEYDAILERFHVLLVQYGNKRILTRVTSGRVIVSKCRRLHEELDDLINRCGVEFHGACVEWKHKFQVDCKAQRSVLESVLQEKRLWMNELQDSEAQTEALTLLLFELDHRAAQYDSAELQLIDRIFKSVASYSKLEVPAIPTWFLPPHEVEFCKQIDDGAYGSVHRGLWIGTSVAVKSVIFLPDYETRPMFLKEAELWSSLQHPHIVKLFGACHVGNPFFVCEYASNGNLSGYLWRPQNRHKTWKCLCEASLGLSYLHTKRKIVHLDIKANNILVFEDGSAKLADFGLSESQADLPLKGDASKVGAVRWKAPEYISGECSGSFACDVYSLGMTIIEAVTQRLPFGTLPDATLKYRAMKNLHQIPKRPEEMTDTQWNLINRMCSTNPDDRVDMAFVTQELKSFADEELNNHLQREWERHEIQQQSSLEEMP